MTSDELTPCMAKNYSTIYAEKETHILPGQNGETTREHFGGIEKTINANCHWESKIRPVQGVGTALSVGQLRHQERKRPGAAAHCH